MKNNQNLICFVCGKMPTVGNNKPNSLHKTKKTIRPNVQKIRGEIMCTRCLRTRIKEKA